MDPPFHGETAQAQPQPQEPVAVQFDPKCLHSVLKEFFDPLRSDDPRADFFAVYRKESDEFDRDYAKKYDEDLNTSLIFAGLFSAVSSAFIIDVQSKLQPDPNDMTAAYMQILIHAVNNTLFPDANLNSVTWTGPPPEIITVQSLLYASLATSLFAAFLAMLGKQWVNRYLRNRGGSAADKSRNRQTKLDGLEKWRFHLAIESLPVMLQLALLLLGCALSLYLWTISPTVAGVVIAVTLCGVTLYVFLTVAATLYYNCPYQTPPSILTRTIIGYIIHSNAAFAHSLRSLTASLPPIKNLRRIIAPLCSGVHSVLKNFDHDPVTAIEVEHVPLAVVAAPPARIFEDIVINWNVCKAEARCISWALHSTTDADVILSTVRFAADMIWYPETAGALSPRILADLFFDCLLDGQVIPGKSEHASSIGMALASVLSIHLSIEPENHAQRELCESILNRVELVPSSEPTFLLATAILRFVAYIPTPTRNTVPVPSELYESIPDRLSATHQLLLSRVILQSIWRWCHIQNPTPPPDSSVIHLIRKAFATGNGQILTILKTNYFLTMAIYLGLRVGVRDLYAPNDNDTLKMVIRLFHQRFQVLISEGKASPSIPDSVISALIHIDPLQTMGTGDLGFLWITEILNSGYEEYWRYEMASGVVELLRKHFRSEITKYPLDMQPAWTQPAWIPPILGFLSLCEKFYATGLSLDSAPVALRILSTSSGSADLCTTILPVLASILLPTHPLRARGLALKVFVRWRSGWFSSQMETVLHKDLNKFLQAISDPFQFATGLPPQDGKPAVATYSEPTIAAIVLIEFASSDLWRNHLHRSNFTSFEETTSTERGRRIVLTCMLRMATQAWTGFLCTPTKIIAAIRRLEELQCPNTTEVVIMWAWTTGVVDPMDHDAWRLIGDDTLRFYQTHGIGRLTALGRYITDTTGEITHRGFLVVYYSGFPFRVGSVRRPHPIVGVSRPQSHCEHYGDFNVSRACQLRRLYHLFGYDPTTWKEAAAVKEVDEETELEVSSELSVVKPVQLLDWKCDC